MTARTSLTHPLQIAEVSAPGARGLIGITFCPGKKQVSAMSGAWDRDLGLDLDAISDWGATTIVTLIEPHELEKLKVTALGPEAEARGIDWLHMPITDVSVPDHRFETGWRKHGPRLLNGIRAGERVLVHCKGGLGRAGTVAARMLVELGLMPDEAIRAVRKVRKGAIETPEQEKHVYAHAAQAGGETILELGADGGSIMLVRKQGANTPKFRVQTSEAALCGDVPGFTPPLRPWVAGWEEALEQLDQYTWVQLHPLFVHPDVCDDVALAVKRRAGGMENCDWASWNRVLDPHEG